MRKIVLISCGSKKLKERARAQELYISPLFRYGLEFAKKMNPSEIYILSAKHRLTELDQEIDPYNLSLNDMTEKERKIWAELTLTQLNQVSDLERDQFTFLAGENYRKYLIPHIANSSIPLEGLGIGRQLQYLRSRTFSK
jgi:hypothetical protein